MDLWERICAAVAQQTANNCFQAGTVLIDKDIFSKTVMLCFRSHVFDIICYGIVTMPVEHKV